MSQGSVGPWYRGDSLPELRTALDLALRTGVCVEWLLTGRGPMYPDAARGDPLLERACHLLLSMPEDDQLRSLDYLEAKMVMIERGASKTVDEALKRPVRETKN